MIDRPVFVIGTGLERPAWGGGLPETWREDQYFELRYENFVAQPLESIERIIEFCDLAPSRRVREHIAERGYRNMNRQGDPLKVSSQ